MKRTAHWRISLLGWALLAARAAAGDFPAPYDSQQGERGSATPPAQALAGITLPEGFRASLFAAEPDVRQPIAMTFDAKGRLWVVENYTYAEFGKKFDTSLRDRILIFNDNNGDGRFDSRKVFWEGGVRLSSVEVGFGGVWVTAPPNLMFLPDRDGDDTPDGEPVVLLDGFDTDATHHTLANGLRWGPDGWLYGRQGIQGTSRVGKPGTPATDRVAVNGSIWRYHPTRNVFELVCQGTTNPWGLDWDAHGQAFFINTVIGHLWHVVPGAHYQRMYGDDPGAKNLYGLIPQTADHYHWDTREQWSDIRTLGVTSGTDRFGGGHAHAGLMIYQGDNWPEAMRGDVYALNFHGRRINRDHLARKGATYIASHVGDPIAWNDPWFRGIDLITGPDGGVYVADWSDIGECHESDGVVRSTGRIYKIVHGTPKAPAVRDVSTLDAAGLVDLQRHPNVWFSRQARRVLQERTAAGADLSEARRRLLAMFEGETDVPLRLRALWCLWGMGVLDEAWLLARLDDPSEHVRTWAVRLLVDQGPPSAETMAAFERLAAKETDGLVLTFLASALQRLPLDRRAGLAGAIARHADFADDPVLPLLVWYGLEPAVTANPGAAAELAGGPAFGPLRSFLARRLAQEGDRPEGIGAVLRVLTATDDPSVRRDLLGGLAEVYRDARGAKPPAGWAEAARSLAATEDEPTRALVRSLSATFGDPDALAALGALAAEAGADAASRREAFRTLVRLRAAGLDAQVDRLLADRVLGADAVRALAGRGGEPATRRLLELYPTLAADAREAAVGALAARPDSAQRLVEAVRDGRIARADVPAFVVRQLRQWDDAPLPALVEAVWGRERPVGAEARVRIARLRGVLSDERLAGADATRGRALFEKTCAQCHKLFDAGGAVGPELTGSQRGDLGYLLENVVDPNATLAPSYRMSIFALADGRVLNGMIAERGEKTIAIQTPTERVVVAPDEIEGQKQSDVSLMPEGLLDGLDEGQVADLVRYLQSPAQVAPAGSRP